MNFDWQKYLGLWYEQYHIPEWFNIPGGTDISAHYRLDEDRDIAIRNSVISNDRTISMYGRGTIIEDGILSVSFEQTEKREAIPQPKLRILVFPKRTQANYIIYFLLVNNQGEYCGAIISNPERTSLHVLTREKQISCVIEAILLDKIAEYWDLNLVVRVRHC